MSDFWAKHDSRNFKATILVIALTKTWIVFSQYLLKIDCNKFLVLHVQCMKTPVWHVTFLHVNVHDCMYWMKTMMVHFDVLIIQLKKLNLCKLYFFYTILWCFVFKVPILCLWDPWHKNWTPDVASIYIMDSSVSPWCTLWR